MDNINWKHAWCDFSWSKTDIYFTKYSLNQGEKSKIDDIIILLVYNRLLMLTTKTQCWFKLTDEVRVWFKAQ